MRHNWISSSIGILLSIILTACSTPSNLSVQETTSPSPITTSVANQKSTTAAKIVALTSLSADIIEQLDKTKLVGIAGSNLLNKDPRFQNITRVSEGQTPPNLEKILALKPDLVIGAEGFTNQTTERLKQLGIPTLLTKIDRWESLEALTKNLAQSINADPQALLNRYQTFLPEKLSSNPTTLVLVSRQPILSPNQASWAGNLLSKFQARNITADFQGKSSIKGYITLSAEKVLESEPEIVIIVNPPQGDSETSILDSFKKETFWNKLKATKNNRVYTFDYYGFVNPGSIDSIEKACKQLKQVLASKL